MTTSVRAGWAEDTGHWAAGDLPGLLAVSATPPPPSHPPSHTAQLRTLPGLACVSANGMDSAEAQFTKSLRLISDWETFEHYFTSV